MSKTDEALEHLKEQGYIAMPNGIPVFTSKMLDYLGVKQQLTKPVDEVYKEFLADRNVVPFRLPMGNGGSYTVSAYSLDGLNGFARALKRPDVSLEKLKTVTREYYRDPRNNRPTMTNYFKNRVWEQAWIQYAGKPKSEDKPYEEEGPNVELG